jgi:hypothetical protein
MHGGSKGRPSVSEIPLDDTTREGYDAESNNSQHGIWRTTEIDIESDEEKDFGSERDRRMRDMRVPESLRTPV